MREAVAQHRVAIVLPVGARQVEERRVRSACMKNVEVHEIELQSTSRSSALRHRSTVHNDVAADECGSVRHRSRAHSNHGTTMSGVFEKHSNSLAIMGYQTPSQHLGIWNGHLERAYAKERNMCTKRSTFHVYQNSLALLDFQALSLLCSSRLL